MTTVIIVMGLLGAVLSDPLASHDVLAGQEFLAVFMRSHQQPRKSNTLYIGNNVILNEERVTEHLPSDEALSTTPWATDITEEPPSQVVKVRVSSSVVRHTGRTPDEAAIAVTENPPTIMAVQRSNFGVDEPSGALTIKQETTPEESLTIESKRQIESSGFTIRQNQQGGSSSFISVHRNVPINLDKLEERTSYSIEIRQDPQNLKPNENTRFVKGTKINGQLQNREIIKNEDVIALKSNETTQSFQETGRNFTSSDESGGHLSTEKHLTRKWVNRYYSDFKSKREDSGNTNPSEWYPTTEIIPKVSKQQFIRNEWTYDNSFQKHQPIRDYNNAKQRESNDWQRSERIYGEPEKNYEVDEAVSIMSSGRTHGVQGSTENPTKLGSVIEDSDFRKYRVEEKTPDGFIVGEYGVVSHNDGLLRGVRYTADSNINPRLIYEALVKFLSLK